MLWLRAGTSPPVPQARAVLSMTGCGGSRVADMLLGDPLSRIG